MSHMPVRFEIGTIMSPIQPDEGTSYVGISTGPSCACQRTDTIAPDALREDRQIHRTYSQQCSRCLVPCRGRRAGNVEGIRGKVKIKSKSEPRGNKEWVQIGHFEASFVPIAHSPKHER